MNQPARRGTLASIAAELGVSRTTVSNAYNRPGQLSEELRTKILQTAEKMGYPGPDPIARSLRIQRAGAVGVLLTEELTYAFDDQASVEFMSGVSQACGEMGVSMLLIPAGVQSDGKDATALVNQAAVDGFIVYSVADEDPYLEAAISRGRPVVICDQPAGREGVRFVGIDDREAIKPVVRRLVDAGHRKIGILCIRLDREPNNGPVSQERLAGARMNVQRDRVTGALAILAEAGIDTASVPLVERHINDAGTTEDAARELLENNPDLTAVVCTTDSMALGLLRYAESAGIDVPGDLSVTGFDGIPQAEAAGLVTVRQPSRTKGRLSGEQLAEEISERRKAAKNRKSAPSRAQSENPPAVYLETTVLDGTSIAAPRA